ncbi:MAG: hypothetical protein ACYCQK_01555 [Acidiferrobacteraceae bacterium]
MTTTQIVSLRSLRAQARSLSRGVPAALPRSRPARLTRCQIRQGDLLLTPIDEPRGLRRAVDPTGQPLAGLRLDGERTGHSHRLPARVYDSRRGRVLFLERPTTLVHASFDDSGAPVAPGDHAAIVVPAGWWQPAFQREYSPARPRPRSRVD